MRGTARDNNNILAPAYQITIQVAPLFRTLVDRGSLHRVASEVLGKEEASGETELSLIITDDEAIRELNRRFRGLDAPTDVLAFGAADEEHFVNAPEGPPYLGDVVVSYQRALAQAKELGHTVEEELALLVVHGTLHLLGYDHQEELAAQKMREKEERIGSVGRSPDPVVRPQALHLDRPGSSGPRTEGAGLSD